MPNIVPWANFRDPNHEWDDGPQPPRRPPKSNREARRQVVWPRDKKQKGAHTWGRFKDVLTGKGPDMYANKQGDTGPHKTVWSGWGYGWDQLPDNMGYADDRDGWPYGPKHGPLGYRSPGKVYDFRKREYTTPHDRVWSDVKWDRRGRDAHFTRNRYGNPWWSLQAQIMQTPKERAMSDQWGYHPFRYNPYTCHWDWYLNELPWNWQPRG
ncbi:MAG: hypothetical protein Q9222_002419 [Ikaeria aurantiellina]